MRKLLLSLSVGAIFCHVVLASSSAANARELSCSTVFWDLAPLPAGSSKVLFSKFIETGVDQLRNANLNKDHIDFFATQLPVVLEQLNLSQKRLEKHLEIMKIYLSGKTRLEYNQKTELKKAISQAIVNLESQINSDIAQKQVSYAKYMDLILNSIVISDILVRAVDTSFEIKSVPFLIKKLSILKGETHSFLEESDNESIVYLSLDSKHSNSQYYFGQFLQQEILIPVFSKPTNRDVIRAESKGVRLLTVLFRKNLETADNQFPMEYATNEQKNNLGHANDFIRDRASRAIWSRFHTRIVKGIDSKIDSAKTKGIFEPRSESAEGMAAEMVYAYLIKNNLIQREVVSALETQSFLAHLIGQRASVNALKKVIFENRERIFFDLQVPAEFGLKMAKPIDQKMLIEYGINALIEIFKRADKESLVKDYVSNSFRSAKPINHP